MRIAMIGAGNVGGTLARRWAAAGHEVILGVRHPEDPKYSSFDARRVTPGEAAASADVVVLATPWGATEDAIGSCGSLSGKQVIDCTNPLKAGLAGLTHTGEDSGAEQIARWAKGARVAKAFNTVGANIMANPVLEDRRAVMFVCGDDPTRSTAARLSDDLGFETIDAGSLQNARYLEPLAMLWISGAYKWGLGRDYALSIVRS